MISNMKIQGKDIRPHVEKLMTWMEAKPRGELLTYQEVSAISGIDIDSQYWGRLISQWRKSVWMKRQAVLLCVKKVGYRIASETEQLNHAARRAKGHNKGLQRCGAMAAATNDELTDAQKLERNSLIQGTAAAVGILQNELKERRLLARRETMPKAITKQ